MRDGNIANMNTRPTSIDQGSNLNPNSTAHLNPNPGSSPTHGYSAVKGRDGQWYESEKEISQGRNTREAERGERGGNRRHGGAMLLIIIAIVVAVAGIVGGAVGGALSAKNSQCNRALNQALHVNPPSAVSISPTAATTSTRSGAAADATSLCSGTITPFTGCPGVDGKIYTAGYGGRFKYRCLTDGTDGKDLLGVMTTTFDLCIEACASWNYQAGSNVRCNGAAFIPSWITRNGSVSGGEGPPSDCVLKTGVTTFKDSDVVYYAALQ